MTILIPMAGAGNRFRKAGYKVSKPLIDVLGKPMIIRTLDMLPKKENEKIILIVRDFHLKEGIKEKIKEYYKNVQIIAVDYLTQGEAYTCLFAEKFINNDEELLIAACDNGFIYNKEKLETLKRHSDYIVFTFKGDKRVCENPNQYCWVLEDEKNHITKISLKSKISNSPINDSFMTGAFWFKKGKYFIDTAIDIINKNEKINNEFYVDKCIENAIQKKLLVYSFNVDKFICWGTPEELNNYLKENNR